MKEEKIKVLALLPMELPKEIELDNTLEAMQKFVGGLIEFAQIFRSYRQISFQRNFTVRVWRKFYFAVHLAESRVAFPPSLEFELSKLG